MLSGRTLYWTSSFTLCCVIPLGCMNQYLTTNCGGYLRTSGLRTFFAVWLNIAQKGREGIRLNTYAMGKPENRVILRVGYCTIRKPIFILNISG